jgi:LPS-assembly protein
MGRLNEVWKTRWLAGAAACAFSCALGAGSTALAQSATPLPSTAAARDPLSQFNSHDRASTGVTTAPVATVNPADVTSDQLLGNDGFYMEADTVIHDEENKTWTARGSVESRYQGRTLRADEVIYNQANGVITAHGNVQMVGADGSIEYSQSMTVDKDFGAGISLAFSTRQPGNAKIAADEAVRLSKDAMELNKAVFTVCDLCAPDGSPQEPTWSIQAAEVVQDHKRQLVFYRHMVIRIKGLPVMAAPIFWHVDPAAKRGPGLLAPRIAYDSRRGLSYEQPYLFILSPSADLVIAPQINTKVNPFIEGEFRERFYSGEIDARFGYTYDAQFDSDGRRYDNTTSRSYILAQGAFAPTDHWTWGFTAERVTDPLLFQRYDVPNVFDQRGLLSTDDQRLISQAYAVEQDAKSYLSISAISFQGLRPGDENGEFPLVAPLVEWRYEPDWLLLGGRIRLNGGGVLLERDRNPDTDTGPSDDSRRASVGGDWQSSYTFYNGIRLDPFANFRGDLYNTVNPYQTVGSNTITYAGDHTVGRALGTVGVDASWPFFRRTGDLTVVLEPLGQIAISPKTTTSPYIPNEDSQVFDLDETNLFDANKSPGSDYYEGGIRANVGGRVTFRWDGGESAQFLLGRSLRTQPDSTLPTNTTLEKTASDWVVAASVQANTAFSAFTRALVNDDGKIDHLEVGVNAANSRANGFIRYLYDDLESDTALSTVVNIVPGTPGVAANINTTQNIQAGGQVLISRRWGVVGSANWDLAAHVPVREEFGLLYQDECTHWEIVYQHDGTYDSALRPSDKIVVRLLLVTLGNSGYQNPQFR